MNCNCLDPVRGDVYKAYLGFERFAHDGEVGLVVVGPHVLVQVLEGTQAAAQRANDTRALVALFPGAIVQVPLFRPLIALEAENALVSVHTQAFSVRVGLVAVFAGPL